MLSIPVPNRAHRRAVLLSSFAAGDSTGPQAKLFRYWTSGEGGRLHIRWGTDGSFARCVRLLSGKVPARYDVKGLCANLHKRATGDWPTEGGKAGIPS